MTQGDRKATFRTLFLNHPATSCSYGGAWARFSARREFRPTWHPIRLAEAASLIANSKLIDAPADDPNLEEVLQRAKGFEPAFSVSAPASGARSRGGPPE
jgi:hypothetical protein